MLSIENTMATWSTTGMLLGNVSWLTVKQTRWIMLANRENKILYCLNDWHIKRSIHSCIVTLGGYSWALFDEKISIFVNDLVQYRYKESNWELEVLKKLLCSLFC